MRPHLPRSPGGFEERAGQAGHSQGAQSQVNRWRIHAQAGCRGRAGTPSLRAAGKREMSGWRPRPVCPLRGSGKPWPAPAGGWHRTCTRGSWQRGSQPRTPGCDLRAHGGRSDAAEGHPRGGEGAGRELREGLLGHARQRSGECHSLLGTRASPPRSRRAHSADPAPSGVGGRGGTSCEARVPL